MSIHKKVSLSLIMLLCCLSKTFAIQEGGIYGIGISGGGLPGSESTYGYLQSYYEITSNSDFQGFSYRLCPLNIFYVYSIKEKEKKEKYSYPGGEIYIKYTLEAEDTAFFWSPISFKYNLKGAPDNSLFINFWPALVSYSKTDEDTWESESGITVGVVAEVGFDLFRGKQVHWQPSVTLAASPGGFGFTINLVNFGLYWYGGQKESFRYKTEERKTPTGKQKYLDW